MIHLTTISKYIETYSHISPLKDDANKVETSLFKIKHY